MRTHLSGHFKKPLLVVTHNMHFLQVERLSRKEALEVSKRIVLGVGEDSDAQEAQEGAGDSPSPEGAGDSAGEEVGNGDAIDSAGDGSGLRLVGGCHSGQGMCGGATDSEIGESDRNQENGKEGSVDSESDE